MSRIRVGHLASARAGQGAGDGGPLRFLLGAMLTLAFSLGTTAWAQPRPNNRGDVTKEQVERAIKEGVRFLKSEQRADGSWLDRDPKAKAGTTSLVTLALLTAGSLPWPEVVDGVVRGLFDEEPDISSAARAAATALKHEPRFQQALLGIRAELLADDPVRRSLAARALGVLHDRMSIEPLAARVDDEDPMSSGAAIDALKEITRFDAGANRGGDKYARDAQHEDQQNNSKKADARQPSQKIGQIANRRS